MSVYKTEVGKRILLPGARPGEHSGRSAVVQPGCENKAGGNWYCITHRTLAHNNFEKDQHIDQPGDHELAWLCFEHGPEIP